MKENDELINGNRDSCFKGKIQAEIKTIKLECDEENERKRRALEFLR